MPDLKESCGATTIARKDAIASSILLTHGEVRVLKPEDAVGTGSIWKFTKPSGQQLFRGALSNNIEYRCPTNGKSLVITVGNQSIVLKPAPATAVVDNTPRAKVPPCGAGCMPNMAHFKAFCKIVDAAFDPTIALAVPFNPGQGNQAGPDYCPGARICRAC